MRWCSFTTTTGGGTPRLGAVVARDDVDRVLDVRVWARSRDAEAPADLIDLVEASPAGQERVADLVRSTPEDGLGWVRLEEVQFAAPVRAPNSLRDFFAFRDHVERGAARRGAEVPEAWDRIPVYYKGNRRSIVGPGDVVVWPSYTEKLDYECEIAAVVGRGGRDLPADSAGEHVFGYTIMNDWSARDVQRDEISCWLGPAKAKDFATTLGPWLVTPDEWSPEEPHTMQVLVDGSVWSEGVTTGRRWTFTDMLAWVSRDEDLYPSDVLGSGTFGGGCGLDLDRWLPAQCEVELRVEGLGTLSNRVERRHRTPPTAR